MDVRGKTAIVTGGGRDIGRACCIALAKAGADVAINYHSSAAGAISAVQEIEAMGQQAVALQGDMTSSADVATLVEATREQLNPQIDILVHVTGGLVARKKFGEMDVQHWDDVFALNTTSLFHLVSAAKPHMSAGGSIVTFASQAGRDGGGPGSIAYAASKGAVMSMTRGMAKEFGPDIRVNSLCPGMIDTDFHNTFTSDEVRAKVAGGTPLKREGTSEDVADLVTYLASDASAFVNGTCIDINGGTIFS